MGDLVGKKLLVPCSPKRNSFCDAVARIVETPITGLSAISDRLKLKCIGERELQFLKEYCSIMKPLTVDLDILQGEENCYYGTFLPTVGVLMSKILEMKEGLIIATGLPDAIVQVRNIHQHLCILWFSLLTLQKDCIQSVEITHFLLQHMWYKCLSKEMFIGVGINIFS